MGQNADVTKKTYDRIAPWYDFLDAIPEHLFYRSWRRELWKNVSAGRILEIGVGTGKNIGNYPPEAQVTAIDISAQMLEKAAARSTVRQDVSIELMVMDVRELNFNSGTFDSVVGSFVLTVLADPLPALKEIKRVLKPGGELILLDFVRSRHKTIALLQDLCAPLTLAVYQAHINRDPARIIERSGFQITLAKGMSGDVVRLFRAALT